MFRIGSALFIPAYLVVTLLRPFASAEDDGNLALMSGMFLSLAKCQIRLDLLVVGAVALAIST
jgi:hypothetical protein